MTSVTPQQPIIDDKLAPVLTEREYKNYLTDKATGKEPCISLTLSCTSSPAFDQKEYEDILEKK